MTNGQDARAQTLARVQGFLDTHAELFAGVNRSAARKRLDAAAKALNAASIAQQASHRQAVGETNQQRAIERELKQGHMTPVAKFARAGIRSTAELAALTPPTGNKEGRRLAVLARSMRVAATPFANQFREAQFPTDFLVQLGTLADWLDASMDRRRDQVQRRTIATNGIARAVADGRGAVATLDAVVTRLIAGNAPLMAGWRSAKRIAAKSGPVRKKARKAR